MKRFFTSSGTLWSCLFAMAMMVTAQSARAEYVKLTALSGTGGTGGEGYASLVDAKVATKMGHSFDPTNPERDKAWIVVKAEKAVVPERYFLVTGSDTGSYPERNWKHWKIYGANFEDESLAVRGNVDDPEAGGWTLIDEQDGTPLPAENLAPYNGEFSETPTTAYQYYWIEILESVKGSDIWLQMAEWGLGTYGEFQKYVEEQESQGTATDEPVVYNIISGDRNDGSGEGLDKLFDGKIDTKWGNGLTAKNYGETTNGAYFIVKTSREMVPTYYKLVTGTDNASWKHRNWNTWQIYGMAKADVPSSGKPTRDSDKWVLLDKKDNISEEVLPDKNMFTVMFGLSEENSTAYQYFKVEIDRTMAGSGYMQMGEFSLGDFYTLAIDRDGILDALDFNPDVFAEKALVDQLAKAVEDLKVCADPFALGELNSTIDDLNNKVNTSESQYAELITVRNQAINLINDDNLKDDAKAYANAWISETDVIAPNNTYPAGNYAFIKANRQLTGAEALAEAKRFSEYLNANVKKVDDPIYATYTALSGSGGFGGEDHSMLIDGDRDATKWCSNSLPGWMIFKTDEPIKPTYYGLVTGGDTDSYKDRNWKSWKIYAANFDSDEDATPESDKWVLIDEKNNVGTDILKTTNKYESYINLSVGCTQAYQYFMLKDVYAWGGLMQMNEFTFYNQGNLAEKRTEFLAEFDGYDPEAETAYQGYIDAYKEKLKVAQSATNPSDVMKAVNELREAQENIASSAEKYLELESWVDELTSAGPASDELEDWFNGYTTENIAPNNVYINGTYAYILKNRQLDNEAIGQAAGFTDDNKEIKPSGEIGYIQSMVNAANEGLYILLDGHTDGEWGDGFYGHLIDGIALNSTEIDPETGKEVTVNATKWGGSASLKGDTYLIFRTAGKTNPFFYTLTTGNDTGSYQDRNWGTWYIYGANFEGDAQATKDAEGWVLIDAKENIGKDRLHPVNAEPSYFGFSTETTEKYTYYKVVVTKAFKGDAIQMNELHFGTAEEFEEIKNDYQSAAYEFDTDITAEQSLIDKYKVAVEAFDECANMEALFRANYAVETLRDSIKTSAAAYAKYQAAVEDAKQYLDENALADSEAKDVFVNYLNGEDGPSEAYPNGGAVYIIDEHVLADSVVLAEIDFMESLKAAAVAKGYGPGMDISSLIVNRTFAKAGETLKDKDGNNIGREAEGWNGYIFRTATDDEGKLYAAEFCNEVSKFDINQTLKDLKNGYYKVTLNAGFRAQGDLLSYNYSAMAYANDTKTFVPVVREYAVEDSLDSWQGTTADKRIESEDKSVLYGWGIWGCEGAAYAFTQGRYAITMVAKVTDGTLTIGVKNEGTLSGGDWLAAGNFGLVYLGEEASAEAIAEAAAYNGERATVLTDVENYYNPGDAYTLPDFKKAPDFAAAQKTALANVASSSTVEQLVADGELFAAINATKAALYKLLFYNDAVSVKWNEFSDACDVNIDTQATADNVADGEYDAEAAEKTLADLLAKYPDYLNISDNRILNATLVKTDGEPFSFEFTATSEKAVTANFSAVMYDELKDNETILEFEYKSAVELTDVKLSNLASQDETDLIIGTLEPTSEFKKVSLDVKKLDVKKAQEMTLKYNAGGKDNVLYVRNVIFVENPAKKGDVDGNGSVGLGDIEAILAILAGGVSTPAADVDGNGSVGLGDIEAILVILAGGDN